MNNLNQVFSKYVLLAATVIATLALMVVEINVDHISYKYIEGSTKPKINFNILDSKLFSSETYTDIFSENDVSDDTNNTSQGKIDKGLNALIEDSNIDAVISAITISDNPDDGNTTEDNLTVIAKLSKPVPTTAEIEIAVLHARIALLEGNASKKVKVKKDHN